MALWQCPKWFFPSQRPLPPFFLGKFVISFSTWAPKVITRQEPRYPFNGVGTSLSTLQRFSVPEWGHVRGAKHTDSVNPDSNLHITDTDTVLDIERRRVCISGTWHWHSFPIGYQVEVIISDIQLESTKVMRVSFSLAIFSIILDNYCQSLI